ncbi:MAG: EAL domain-containing protein, partial [Methylococcaceae bacterium]|nr:EAL domain-containing protein [Methylococcaceae bacterium]
GELERQLQGLRFLPEVADAAFLQRDASPLAEVRFRQDMPMQDTSGSAGEGHPAWWRLLLDRTGQQTAECLAPIRRKAEEADPALLRDEGESIGSVRIGLNVSAFRQDMARSLRLALGTSLAIVAVGMWFTLGMTRRIIAPMRSLAVAARKMALGQIRPVDIHFDDAEIRELSESFNSMSERLAASRADMETYHETLVQMAYYDELTGLANRALLRDHIDLALAQASRHQSSMALLFLDLDRFKNINDSLGHSMGDRLLKGVAERLRACIRCGDTVARMGGDEFVVVLNDLSRGAEQAVAESGRVAEKIGQVLASPFRIQDHEITATFSIGIALCPRDGENGEELIKQADAAMYSAKALGRNNYQFYTPEMGSQGIHRLTLESDLRRALERDEFELYFQPQFSRYSRRVVGAEALIRWRQRDGSLHCPKEFIALAEETGLILPLGEWVLNAACTIKSDWSARGICPPEFEHIAINVSPQQFWSPNFANKVLEIIAKSGLDHAGGLEMELTENCLMRHTDEVMDTFSTLKEAGVRFAVDDFGTGYSSLHYLKKFPLDGLKIDQSFVRDCTKDPGDDAIIRAIIAMADGLGLKVIAEGVERQGQVDFLLSHGCKYFQGFGFGVPVSAKVFEQTYLLQPSPG